MKCVVATATAHFDIGPPLITHLGHFLLRKESAVISYVNIVEHHCVSSTAATGVVAAATMHFDVVPPLITHLGHFLLSEKTCCNQ